MKLLKNEIKIKLLSLIIILASTQFLEGQNEVINSNMEDSTGWTVYKMDRPIANYEFNYTVDGPSQGSGGCLRITSDVATNILVWQKINLKGGKSYIVDGTVKTGNVASFWCEVYVSLIQPIENQDYSPNSNGDREWIISTWNGCGPNLDGKLSEVSCGGDGIYYSPGVYDEDIEVYFGIKTGSMANPMPNSLEVLLDEFSLQLVEDWYLTRCDYGILNQDSLEITGVSPLMTVAAFKSGLRVAVSASVEIIGKNAGNPIPNQSSVYIHDTMMVQVSGNQITNYKIDVRPIGTGNDIIAALTGTVDSINLKVTDLPVNAKVIQLKSSIITSPFASSLLLDTGGQEPLGHDIISSDMYILVTAENGDEKTYTIEIGTDTMPTEIVIDSIAGFSYIKNKIYDIEGNIEWHVTRDDNPLMGSIINIKSKDTWIYFDSIKPSEFNEMYLDHILVSDTAAVIYQNVRLVQYLDGCVLIGHDIDYIPLTIYDEEDLGGSSMDCKIYAYYKSSELGTMNNAIKSLILRKGYMATLARDDEGTGYSRVYIADTGNIVIDSLPAGLYNKTSFIRVFPWRWVTKKAWRGNADGANLFGATSFYDYNTAGISTLDNEYVPMRHNPNWNSFSYIYNKENSTHALGYNEPDNEGDDGYSTVQGAIDMWPNLMKSGLRLGSPAPTDGGLSWLYDFIDRCDQLNYRVDFVAWHFYRAFQSPQSFWNALKGVHDRTGRPIWITEWNNGCNWTYNESNVPSYEENAIKIEQFTYMLDTTSFVERYFVWDGCNETLQMTYSGTTNLTPAGIKYRDQVSAMALNHNNEFYKEYIPYPEKAYNPVPAKSSTDIPEGIQLAWTPGELAASHRVYFGTSSSSLSYKGAFTDSVFNPGLLLPNKLYYWRIDEIYKGRITKGDVWSFKTGDYVSVNSIQNMPEIKIYPQPVSDILNIHGMGKKSNVEIFDILGNKVYSALCDGIIYVGDITDGIYILKIEGYNPVRILKVSE